MSLIPSGTSIFQAGVLNILPLVFIRPRSIGGIIANVTVDEKALDELQITEHPVEQGASVTDHAFKRNAMVTISAGWSNSSLAALGNPNYVVEIYDALLELQRLREPFDVITGKRFYQNMLLQRLFTTTDATTENALMVVAECREIIIVSSQTVTVPPAGNMKSPQSNGATTDAGSKQLKPGSNYNGFPSSFPTDL